ncbi:2-oxoacid:acceptor oxidoreductase family protein [Acidianus manzaensis]|uniref:pyruvate synthase n=1 Tax=Acidianus manzaensis TaxID=282676 RepID=A0A1W6JWX3_9CREN|nr:2-oxoacid:acceptor oxidoreductase family protein [Acidianus manzaensis]ARM74732.1 pyruvate synthase [Acidianus manzaensis]
MLEIRFHGRGGQGVVTASNLLAVASDLDGYWSSAFPIYGAERRGAEIEAYCRIDSKPIRVTSPIENPDYVVILDPTLLKISSNPLRGLKKSSVIVINSPETPTFNYRTFYTNATQIAVNFGLVKSGWPLVNIIMLGSLIKAIGKISLNSLEKAIDEEFDEKIAESNKKAIRYAYENTKEVKLVVA